MTPDNIRAIEEDRKTVTRRVIKPQPVLDASGYYWNFYTRDGGRIRATLPEGTDTALAKYAPYHVGEVVYIKEAWATEKKYNHLKPRDLPMQSAACLTTARICYLNDYILFGRKPDWAGKWRSPLFMPAWAARRFLKILDVRAERLQAITLEECEAEGIYGYSFTKGGLYRREKFIELWDSLNPKYPFSSNPWNFRYGFKKVNKEG